MLPSALVLKRAPRDSADEISQGKPLEISKHIYAYEPNDNKALSYFNQHGFSKDSARRTFGHLEKAYDGQFVRYEGVTEVGSTQATTGLVFDSSAGLKLTAGSRVMNLRLKDIVRFTAAFASATTSAAVHRNYGRGTAADLWIPGDKCVIMPPNFPEGFTTGEAISQALSYKSFQMGESSEPVEVTYVENAEKQYSGDPFQEALENAIVRLKKQQEVELLYGGKKLDTSTYTHPIGASEGVDNFITTNRFSASKLSRLDFFDILTAVKVNCPYKIDILCSIYFKQMVTEWAMSSENRIVNVPGYNNQTLGYEVDKIVTTAGTFDMIDVHLLSQSEELMGEVFFVPRNDAKPNWGYRPLVGNGEDLDVRYVPISNDAKHTKQGEIYGVFGRQFMNEETWGKLEDLEFGG